MRKTVIGTFLAFVFGSVLAMPAVAETMPEDAAKYRQYIMRALSGHFGAVTMTARGLAGDPANSQKHTSALVALAAEIGPAFEAAGGAPVDDTEALPAIWEQPDAYAAAVEEFAAAVQAFDAAVAGGDSDTVMATHREVGAACKGCHEDFRLDD